MTELHDILKSAKDKLNSRIKPIRVNCKRNGKYGQLAGFTYIDPEDYDLVRDYSWSFHERGYVQTCINGKIVRMHRLIMDTPAGSDTDHITGYKSDNRKSNLRICSCSQNHQNRHKTWGKSKFKGVSWFKDRNKWHTQIMYNGKLIHLGDFENEIEAAKVYDKKALELFGEFARTNKMLGRY